MNIQMAGQSTESSQLQLKQVTSDVDKHAKQIRKIARDFEAMFIGMMLKSMRETVQSEGVASGGRGEELYRSLLDQEYATAIASSGGIGLAQIVEQQLATQGTGQYVPQIDGHY